MNFRNRFVTWNGCSQQVDPTFNSSGHLELDGVSDFVNGNVNISNLGFSGDQSFSILCWN